MIGNNGRVIFSSPSDNHWKLTTLQLHCYITMLCFEITFLMSYVSLFQTSSGEQREESIEKWIFEQLLEAWTALGIVNIIYFVSNSIIINTN